VQLILFPSFEHERSRKDLGAKLGANGHSHQATPGHNQLASAQLDGLLSDTRRHKRGRPPQDQGLIGRIVMAGSQARLVLVGQEAMPAAGRGVKGHPSASRVARSILGSLKISRSSRLRVENSETTAPSSPA
jgi:hypothetical protein